MVLGNHGKWKMIILILNDYHSKFLYGKLSHNEAVSWCFLDGIQAPIIFKVYNQFSCQLRMMGFVVIHIWTTPTWGRWQVKALNLTISARFSSQIKYICPKC